MSVSCPGCFGSVERSASSCNRCGYDRLLQRSPLVLPHLTELNHGRYWVGRLLGRPGGFGIAYLGWDERLRTKVAIKEYLPRDLASRGHDRLKVVSHSPEDGEKFDYGLEKFLDEARTLAQVDHSNIVRIKDYFKDNGTAYIVMDYYDGLTVSEYLTRQSGGKIPESASVSVMLAILDGLKEVHRKGFLHRDIKPQNIYLTTGNRPILLDFGAARQSVGEHSRSLSVVVSEGYAPIEQYQRNAQQGPWTDIYGVAATLYYMVTGKTPATATDRIADETLPGLGALSVNLREAITRGMASNPSARIRSVEEFQAVLSGVAVNSGSAAATRPASAKSAPPPIPRAVGIPATEKSKNGIWWAGATIVVFILIIFSMWKLNAKTSSPPVQVTTNKAIKEKQREAPLPIQNSKPPGPSAEEQAAEEAKLRIQLEAKIRAEVETKIKAEADAKIKAEQLANKNQKEIQKKAERLEAERLAKLKADEDARIYEGPKANAAYLHNPKPLYPAMAKRQQWEGKVILKVKVLASGAASEVSIQTTSGHEILDEAALEAVRQWHFVPAKRGGQPVDSWVGVPINFNLLETP